MLLRMAWLNIWRNRRRTVVLLCAVVVGLAGVIFLAGLMNAWMDSMISNAVRTSEAHVKVLTAGYNLSPIVENNMLPPRDIEAWLDKDSRVRAWGERVTVQGLISSARHSAMVKIVGIEPDREHDLSAVAETIREGEFLTETDSGTVLVGRRLLDNCKVRLGSKLVLMSQQLGGDIGSGAFRVSGVFQTGNSAVDEYAVFVHKRDLQKMLNLEDRITEVVIMLGDIGNSRVVAAEIKNLSEARYLKVMPWQELLPFVSKSIEVNKTFMVPFYGIFYLAMAFGVLNTLLMSIGERTYEFGVLLAVGMKPRKVMSMIMLESLCIAALGSAIGVAIGWGSVVAFAATGMDFSAFAEAMDYMGMDRVIYPRVTAIGLAAATAAAFAVAVIFSVYPAWRASRMKPIKALRITR